MLPRYLLLPALGGLLCLFSGAALAQEKAPSQSPPTFRPAVEADEEIPLKSAPPGSSGSALLASASLEATPRCGSTLPRTAIVDLAWDLGDAAGVSAQRVDISKLHEGFASGSFETTGAQAKSLSAVAVEAPEAGVNYYWRVLARSGDGWVSSPVRRFRVPVCKSDPLEPDQRVGILLNDAAEGN